MAQLVHVVLVDWAETAPADVAAAATALVDRHLTPLPGIVSLDRGGSVSGEGLESGFEWALVIRFADERALADYLPHPEHQVVGGFLQEHAARLVVFDLASA
jgi:hypothetical protein